MKYNLSKLSNFVAKYPKMKLSDDIIPKNLLEFRNWQSHFFKFPKFAIGLRHCTKSEVFHYGFLQ